MDETVTKNDKGELLVRVISLFDPVQVKPTDTEDDKKEALANAVLSQVVRIEVAEGGHWKVTTDTDPAVMDQLISGKVAA